MNEYNDKESMRDTDDSCSSESLSISSSSTHTKKNKIKLPDELRQPKIFDKLKSEGIDFAQKKGRTRSDVPLLVPNESLERKSSVDSNSSSLSSSPMSSSFLSSLQSKFNLTDIFVTHRSLAQSIGRLFIAILNLKDLESSSNGYYNVKTYIENSQNNKYNQFITKPIKGSKSQGIKMLTWNDEFNFLVESEEDVIKIVLEKLHRGNIFKNSTKNIEQTSQQKSLYKGKKPTALKTIEVKLKELISGELKNLTFDIDTDNHKFQLDVRLQFLPQEQEKKFQEFEELVVSDIRYIDAFSSCCTLLEIDATANALVNVFQWHDKSTSLLEWAIKKEVDKINAAPLLFREQSLAVKIFSLSVFYHGKDYVKQILQPFIQELDKDEPLEINPGSIESNEILNNNRERLKKYATTLMNKIWKSVGLLPTLFKQIGIMLKKIVGDKFPKDVYTTFSGFFFLRFLVPCLVAPTTWDIVEEIQNAHTKRTLVLIGKLITSMANRIYFGDKEVFMIPLNDWIDENDKLLIEFFKSIVEDPSSESKINHLNIRKRSIYNDLHSFVHRNLNAIVKQLDHLNGGSIRKVVNELGTPEAEIEKVETVGIIGMMNVTQKLKEHFLSVKKMSGKDVVSFLKEHAPICESSRVNAMLLAERLVEMELMSHHKDSSLPFTDDEELYVFDAASDYCLNSSRKWTSLARHPLEVSTDLLKGVSLLYLRACSMTGTILTSEISLASIAQYPDYKLFTIATKELQKLRLNELTEEEKPIFWLNIFNLLVMHSHIYLSNLYGLNNSKYLSSFFNKTCYLISGSSFTLSDILFGIFRRNAKLPSFKSPYKSYFKWSPWKDTDPRSAFVLHATQPMAFFGLCMSFADSPSLQIFQKDEYEKQLNEMIVTFLSSNVLVDLKLNSVKIPALVSWFETDFLELTKSKDLFSFLNDTAQKYQIKNLLSQFSSLDKDHKHGVKTEIIPFDFTFSCDLNLMDQELQL